MANEIVPFGKYKGRPVEALAADRSYTDWLTAQPWFRDRYQGIYTLIINNFTEPSETPEHNAFQVLFLDDEFCLRCVDCAYGVSREQDEHVLGLEKECREKGLVLIGYFSGEVVSIDDIKSILVVSSEFEKNGADVFLNLAYTVVGPSGETVYCKRSSYTESFGISRDFWIEIKPSIGDDYPAVLRQMRGTRSRGRPILFVGEYAGIGATREQFIETFKRAGIAVVFRGDVE